MILSHTLRFTKQAMAQPGVFRIYRIYESGLRTPP